MAFTPTNPIWTESDLTAVASAMQSLATGAQVATVSFGGSIERAVSYTPADMDTLERLYARIYDYLDLYGETTATAQTLRVLTSKR